MLNSRELSDHLISILKNINNCRLKNNIINSTVIIFILFKNFNVYG